jgi:acyl-coenzyme A thioesterase PaaI-like protein
MPQKRDIESIIKSSSIIPSNLSHWLKGDKEKVSFIHYYNEKQRLLIWEFRPQSNTMGAPGYCHGGFLTSVMDEAMGSLAYLNGHIVMSALLQVKFRNPVPLNQVYFSISELLRIDSKRIQTECRITDIDNKVYASSSGLYVQLPEEMVKDLLTNFKQDI